LDGVLILIGHAAYGVSVTKLPEEEIVLTITIEGIESGKLKKRLVVVVLGIAFGGKCRGYAQSDPGEDGNQ
jgi:hypothetical protein